MQPLEPDLIADPVAGQSVVFAKMSQRRRVSLPMVVSHSFGEAP